jgi:uncharacterized protein with HEPN domain
VSRRSIDDRLADLLEATSLAATLVRRGRETFLDDQLLQLSAEAIAGRIGDAATKLEHLDPTVLAAMPEIPWPKVKGLRIVVDHAYHRVNVQSLWETMSVSVPELRQAIERLILERQGPS